MYQIHPDFPEEKPVTGQQLEEICDKPVFKRELFDKPVIIKKFELLFNNNLYLLRCWSEEGDWGVSVPSPRVTYLGDLLEQQILPFFIGKDARDLEKLLEQVYVLDNNYKLSGLAYWCPISWLEGAILDMLGRMKGVPVGELLGDVLRDEVSIYIASGNRGTTPEEEIEILAGRVEKAGAKAIKFKVGGRMSRNLDSMAGRSENLLMQTRKHFGDDMIIHADGNGSYDAEHGIQIGKLCEEIDAYFFEEPCLFDDLWATREVAQSLTIPLAFGEQETSLRRFQWIIENNAAQVIQPDLQYNGGFIRNTKVARMAEAAGKVITPHVSGGFAAVYTLHYLSYIPNIGEYHEYKHFDDCYELFTPELVVKDGKIKLPQGPGLGMQTTKRLFRYAHKLFTVQ